MAQTPTKITSKAIGRRKEATASVRLLPGDGTMIVNGKPVDVYFPGEMAKMKYTKPFEVLSLTKYSISAKVKGGGQTGQLEAMVLGIARSLAELKAEYKQALRTAGLVTRDPRERQRRQVGTGGKSRRQKQSPKR